MAVSSYIPSSFPFYGTQRVLSWNWLLSPPISEVQLCAMLQTCNLIPFHSPLILRFTGKSPEITHPPVGICMHCSCLLHTANFATATPRNPDLWLHVCSYWTGGGGAFPLLQMRLVVHRVTLIELFGELLNYFLSDHATRVPLDFIESSNFFLHPPSTCYFLFYYSHAKDCEMCYYSFDLHFLKDWLCWASFHTFLDHLHSCFEETFVQVYC